MPEITAERLKELEDAERTAWCLTVGIHQRDATDGDATWLIQVDGVWRLVSRRECGTHRVFLKGGSAPLLTDFSCRVIDAARNEGGTET